MKSSRNKAVGGGENGWRRWEGKSPLIQIDIVVVKAG